MALALQLGGVGASDWRTWIGRLPQFREIGKDKETEIIAYLQHSGILFGDSGLLGLGEQGEARYGRRHFLELLSVFSSPAMLTAFHGTRELGHVEAGFLVTAQKGEPASIALGGKSWIVRQVDWRARRIYVEPSENRGRGAWIGSGQGMTHHIAQAVRTVLCGNVASNLWSTRAAAALQRIRDEHAHVHSDGNTLVVFAESKRTEWVTFAGGKTNELLASHLHDLSITFPEGTALNELQHVLASLTVDAVAEAAVFDNDAVEALKFHECLPASVRQEVLKRRFVDARVIACVLSAPTRTVLNPG
jgi:ATP-dependent Lhr-like helicase